MHEVKKILATLLKMSTSKTQASKIPALECCLKKMETNLASEVSVLKAAKKQKKWICTVDDSPSNADDYATIPGATHVAAQCFQWYDSVSRCSSKASSVGAALKIWLQAPNGEWKCVDVY